MGTERILKLLVRTAEFFVSLAKIEIEQCKKEQSKQRRIANK